MTISNVFILYFYRYMRRDGTLRLSDFISAILHLTMAFELFKAKDTNQDGVISMGMTEVSVQLYFTKKAIITIFLHLQFIKSVFMC